jgi:hypothetical protein
LEDSSVEQLKQNNLPGDYFMIPISEVKNINITYYGALPEEGQA